MEITLKNYTVKHVATGNTSIRVGYIDDNGQLWLTSGECRVENLGFYIPPMPWDYRLGDGYLVISSHESNL